MKPRRIHRPLGLTIAILAGMFFFGTGPLLNVYLAWRLDRSLGQDTIDFGTSLPFDSLTILGGVLGALVLVSAVFAWRGKPQQSRFIFQGLILLTAITVIGTQIYRVVNDESNIFTDSSAEALKSIFQCLLPLQITIAVYIIWYCNRAPARAFYRQEPYTPNE
jgi:hypothetical protein